MEPLDTYFLLFPSLSDAAAYRKEVRAQFQSAAHQWRLTIAPPDWKNMALILKYGERSIRSKLQSLGQPDILKQQLQSEHLVAIKLDGGRLSLDRLKALLGDDGIDRNLSWKLKASWGQGGISLTAEAGPAAPKSMDTEDARSRVGVYRKGDKSGTSSAGLASRFFLSFQTADEARRFARQWHKRRLVLKDSRLSIVNTTLIT